MAFLDADDLHPRSNVDKMRSGQSLTDEDRLPWLIGVRKAAEEHHDPRIRSAMRPRDGHAYAGLVVACSSLKRCYRDILRGTQSSQADPHTDATALRPFFVFLQGDKDVLAERLWARRGHFMKLDMLQSQLETLEDPSGEPDVVVVPVGEVTGTQVRMAKEQLSELCERGCSVTSSHA
jgi:gluconokinase